VKILVVGDIVGSVGRRLCRDLIKGLVRERGIDFVIANAENAAAGSGVTPKITEEFLSYGIDMLTSGNHIWRRKEILEKLIGEPRLLRPHNYPAGLPGKGVGLYETKSGKSIGIINLMGRVFMPAIADCPFRAATDEIEKLKAKTPVIIIDFHAEATSEKIAFARFVQGKASLVFGTHTHVQTADETVFGGFTAYISDVGMTGPFDSVIGRNTEQIIKRFITQVPDRADVAEGDPQLSAIVVDIDAETGKARSIERVQKKSL